MPLAIDLARRYAEALAALRAVHLFDAWLGHHWHERCPAEEGLPVSHTALSPEDAITWYESEETILGFLPGEEGCFRIPRAVPLPEFPFAADAQAIHYGQDVVISAEMREALHPPES
jgi:hypothetical protein